MESAINTLRQTCTDMYMYKKHTSNGNESNVNSSANVISHSSLALINLACSQSN